MVCFPGRVPAGAARLAGRTGICVLVGVGISRLGTSEAIAIGAYAFALRHLDLKK